MESRLVILAVAALALVGCTSVERAPLTSVPTPEANLYAHDETAQAKYRIGFEQGYSDYLKGQGTISMAYHYRSPDARLHGYSDGKLEAMRFVKNSGAQAMGLAFQKQYSHEETGWFDKYGELFESGAEFKWNGFR